MKTQANVVCPADGVEAASHFLHSWFVGCEGIAELRYLQDGKMRQEWFALDCLNNMACYAVELSDKGCEVYFGVATRIERKGRKSSVAMVPGPFCDLDFTAFEAGGIEAIERLDRYRPQPTAVVHSGAGLHTYWRLKNPLLPTKETAAIIRSLVRE